MRTTGLAIDSVLDDDLMNLVIFVELQFLSGTLYLHNSLGEIDTLGETWLGAGDLGSVELGEESEDGTPNPTVLVLSGIDTALVAIARTENYMERPAIFYLGNRDLTSGELASDPFEIGRGKMDVMQTTAGGEFASIKLTVENEMADHDRAPMLLYSDQQLQKEFSGDLAFQYMPAMANHRVVIGSKIPSPIGVPGTSLVGSPFNSNFARFHR